MEIATKSLLSESWEIKEILRKNKGERYIRITGWNNYWKAYKIGLFDLCSRKKKLFIDKCKKTKFYFKINKDFKEDLFSINNMSQRQLAFKIGTIPSTICVLRKEEDSYFESKLLIKLCKLKNITFDEIKKQIVSVRVNKTTLIEDKKLVEFVISMSEKLLKQSSKHWQLTD